MNENTVLRLVNALTAVGCVLTPAAVAATTPAQLLALVNQHRSALRDYVRERCRACPAYGEALYAEFMALGCQPDAVTRAFGIVGRAAERHAAPARRAAPAKRYKATVIANPEDAQLTPEEHARVQAYLDAGKARWQIQKRLRWTAWRGRLVLQLHFLDHPTVQAELARAAEDRKALQRRLETILRLLDADIVCLTRIAAELGVTPNRVRQIIDHRMADEYDAAWLRVMVRQLVIIDDGLKAGRTRRALADELKISPSGVTSLLARYLPHHLEGTAVARRYAAIAARIAPLLQADPHTLQKTIAARIGVTASEVSLAVHLYLRQYLKPDRRVQSREAVVAAMDLYREAVAAGVERPFLPRQPDDAAAALISRVGQLVRRRHGATSIARRLNIPLRQADAIIEKHFTDDIWHATRRRERERHRQLARQIAPLLQLGLSQRVIARLLGNVSQTTVGVVIARHLSHVVTDGRREPTHPPAPPALRAARFDHHMDTPRHIPTRNRLCVHKEPVIP